MMNLHPFTPPNFCSHQEQGQHPMETGDDFSTIFKDEKIYLLDVSSALPE
jgi:hypothetical protein